eukprot:5308074-Pyramimonas_sp.AAC.1
MFQGGLGSDVTGALGWLRVTNARSRDGDWKAERVGWAGLGSGGGGVVACFAEMATREGVGLNDHGEPLPIR